MMRNIALGFAGTVIAVGLVVLSVFVAAILGHLIVWAWVTTS